MAPTGLRSQGGPARLVDDFGPNYRYIFGQMPSALRDEQHCLLECSEIGGQIFEPIDDLGWH